MQVTFYKTKLNEQSRCYDALAYDNYLAACTRATFDFNTTVVQDNAIQVPSTENALDWELYNYMTWEINGLKYGAFVDDIRYNAISRTTTITHTRDVWYFILHNCDFDMHGQAIRAHVNDLERSGNTVLPTLKNTYATPEEQFNTENVVRDRINPFGYSGYKWIYIYFNNPHAYELGGGSYDDGFYQVCDSQFSESGLISLTGMVAVGTVNPVNGMCRFRPTDDTTTNSALTGRLHIGALTGTQIGAMVVTDIPPTAEATINGLGEFTLNTTGFWHLTPKDQSKPADGYPNYMCAPIVLNMFNKMTVEDLRKKANFNNLVWNDTAITEESTYTGYLEHIVKAKSTVYNPVFVDGNYISSVQMKGTDTIRYGLSPDFSYHWTRITANNLKDRSQLSVKNCLGLFKPDTVVDGWTRLNASRATLAAKQQKFNSIMQGIGNAWNAGKNYAMGSLSQMLGGYTNSVKGGVAGVGQYASGSAGKVDAVINGVQGAQNAGYNYRMSVLNERIAEVQYQNGIISSEVITAYYINIVGDDDLQVEIIRQNDDNLKHIQKRLHRYGYFTYLQLDDIYKNHRRRNFNYIQTINAEVSGVPSAMAEEISQMFNNGVHLWSGKVEDWEVVNYQNDIFEEAENV